jgi:hypothetical protein
MGISAARAQTDARRQQPSRIQVVGIVGLSLIHLVAWRTLPQPALTVGRANLERGQTLAPTPPAVLAAEFDPTIQT